MIYIAVFCLLLSLLTVSLGVINFLKTVKIKKNNQVHPGALSLFAGGFCSFLTALILLAMSFSENTNPFIFAAFCALSLFGDVLTVKFINYRITYEQDKFTVRNLFGIERTYSFDDLHAISGKRKVVIYMKDKKKIPIGNYHTGKKSFVQFINKKYRENNNGCYLPEIKEKDIFNGNVKRKSSFVLVTVFLIIIPLCFILFISSDSKYYSQEELQYDKVVFTDYKHVMGYRFSESHRFYASGKPLYYTLDMSFIENNREFWTAFENGETFEIGVTYIESWGTAHYSVASLSGYDGKIYYTLEMFNEHTVRNKIMLISLFSIFILLGVLLLARMICISRHPEKYREKTRNRYFGKGFFKADGKE